MGIKKGSFAILGLVAVMGLGGCATKSTPTPTNNTNATNTVGPVVTDTKWAGLAKALTKAGAKFYGAQWCSHCAEQKKLFGDALQYVPYVECAPDENDPYKQAETCKAAKVEGYPTWIFADGSRVERVMIFDELAAKINYQSAK